MRNIIKRLFRLYEITDLEIGAHCGLCGNWISDIIIPKTQGVWDVTCENTQSVSQEAVTTESSQCLGGILQGYYGGD